MPGMRLLAACLASTCLTAADLPLTGGPEGLHRAGTPTPIAAGIDASWIVSDRQRGLLYAIGGGRASELVALRPDGQTLGRWPLPGAHACAGTLLHAGRVLITVSYSGGTAAAFQLDDAGLATAGAVWTASGASGVHPKRQEAPHLHDAVAVPDDPDIVLVPDLGSDRVHVLRVAADAATIMPADPAWTSLAPGSGPRHLAFAPPSAGRHDAYVIGELDLSLTRCTWDGTRLIAQERTALLDAADAKATGAEVIVHPSGRSVYATVRGPDLVVVLERDPANGALTLRERRPAGGRIPRHARLDATGATLWVAHQGSSTLTAFSLNPATGLVTGTGATLPSPKPAFVVP